MEHWRQFENCTSLEKVTIGNGVTNIQKVLSGLYSGDFAINMPSSITKINESAFRECTALEQIVLPESLTTIGISAFVVVLHWKMFLSPIMWKQLEVMLFGAVQTLFLLFCRKLTQVVVGTFQKTHFTEEITIPIVLLLWEVMILMVVQVWKK